MSDFALLFSKVKVALSSSCCCLYVCRMGSKLHSLAFIY